MASQLRRSADRLSNNEPATTNEPSSEETQKRRSGRSSSSSSNELNISRPDDSLEDEYTRLACNGIDGIPKVCNLHPSASDDEYARVKVNNLDVSVDSGKRGAYAKFDDDFNVTGSSMLEGSNESVNSDVENKALSPDDNS